LILVKGCLQTKLILSAKAEERVSHPYQAKASKTSVCKQQVNRKWLMVNWIKTINSKKLTKLWIKNFTV
jgi:hypothetical protein